MGESGLPTVGIVGGGQLARMMYQDAISLDLPVRFLVATPDETLAQLSPDVTVGSPFDAEALAAFSARCDVMTFDHELVNLEALESLEAAGASVRPSSRALRHASNKWIQRQTLSNANIPVPAYADVIDEESIVVFASQYSWPVVLKAKSGGYDGRGVWIAEDLNAAKTIIAEASEHELQLYVEQLVELDEEVAIIVARDVNGNAVTYPLIHSVQDNGMCREASVVRDEDNPLATQAAGLALKIAELVDVCGVMAVEMFVSNGKILINELATRPHNTGHYSIEGAETSQFENHLRAVSGLPLGSTASTAPASVMVNIVGSELPFSEKDLAQAMIIPGVHVHIYGKSWRPGRKLGHVTVCADSVGEARDRAYAAVQILEPKS